MSDDPDLVAVLDFVLERDGFIPVPTADLPTARKWAQHDEIDLAVLDLDLRGLHGRTVLKELRRATRIPIIVLSWKTGEEGKIEAFETGADDYLTKPVNHRELLARLRARMRFASVTVHLPKSQPSELRAGQLTLNVREHLVKNRGRPVSLTATEFRVLQYMMLNAGHVVETRTLARHVWGWASPQSSNLQRVTICRLRRKLETNPTCPQLLRTVPGVGVMLDPGRGTAKSAARV